MAGNDVVQMMINCIKNEICGQSEKIALSAISMQDFVQLYNFSKAHDVAPIVCNAILSNHLIDDKRIEEKYQSEVYSAIYRYESMAYELEQIKGVFNEGNIPFIPLKGAVIRAYYPEAWMRTSCDIDILVKTADLDAASRLLIEKLQYSPAVLGVHPSEKGSHDVSFFSPSGVHVELHFSLLEIDCKKADDLENIWTGSEISVKSSYEYHMSDELFLLYHIYHMAKHVSHGGCGIKPFIDLYILRHKVGYNEDKAKVSLEKSGLLQFYNEATHLMRVWFDGEAHTAITKRLEGYILQGGVYGTLTQRVAVSQSKKGGKIGHLFSRIFISYKEMLIFYPSLKKCPILFPLYQVRRWCRILFGGYTKKAVNEIKVNGKITKEQRKEAERLMKDLDLA